MTKKIGILFGMEDTFPWAFIDRVNAMGDGKVYAEPVSIDKVQQGIDYGYHVIIDRISQEVPFYRAYLKMQPLAVRLLSTIHFGGVQTKNSSITAWQFIGESLYQKPYYCRLKNARLIPQTSLSET